MQGMQAGQQLPPMAFPSPMISPPVNWGPAMAPGLAPSPNLGYMNSTQTPGASGLQAPPQQQRAMSMLNPNIATQWAARDQRMSIAASFAPNMRGIDTQNKSRPPSIAPSERSNIGMAPRYRPVSMAPSDMVAPMDRAATPLSMAPLDDKPGVRVTVQAVQRPAVLAASDDDDDDEEAWAEMTRKREEKKALRREMKTNDLADVYYPPPEEGDLDD
jgi:hypothetical protein